MKYILMFFAGICCLHTVMAQQTWKAIVVNASTRQPVAASIYQLRTNTGMVASEAGLFAVSAMAGDTIRISHAGYRTLLHIFTQPGADTIPMQSEFATLDEVLVNTGYQLLPKERATGSFSQVSAKTLNEQVSTNILSRLEAVANGLAVDRKSVNDVIVIRGVSTIRGGRDPLIIVDNFPYSGDLGNINPNDVENITVLKDAAASSIWGAKAANGVIVITLKKARAGQPLTVAVNSNLGFTGKPNLGYLQTISPADLVEAETFLFSKGHLFADTASNGRPPFSPVYEILFKKRAGTITEQQANSELARLAQHDMRDDLQKYFYSTALNRQVSVSMQAGTEQVGFVLSAGYDKNVDQSSALYNRFTLRTETTVKLGKKINWFGSVYYTQSNTQSGKPGYNDMRTSLGKMPAYTFLAGADGSAIPVTKTYRQLYADTAGAGKLLDWNYYPMLDHLHQTSATTLQNMTMLTGLSYRFIKGLSLDVKFQYDKQTTETTGLADIESHSARATINTFSQINRTTGVVTYRVPMGGILDKGQRTMESKKLRGQLNYTYKKGRHELNAIAGAEMNDVQTDMYSYRTYGYNESIGTGANVDFATAYTSFVTGSPTFIYNPADFGGTVSRFVSGFSNAAYTYNNKYTASASVRKDASNSFGVNTNDRWNLLWSSGLAWDIDRERFFDVAFLNKLRLRVTYGASGNVDPSMVALTTVAYSLTSTFTQSPTARFDKYANPELRWEKINMLNIGLDFGLKNNIVQGSLEFYHKRGKDLYGTEPIDYTSVPAPTLLKNIASISGSGADLDIAIKTLDRKVKWTTQLNLSYNTDKVKEYYSVSLQAGQFVNSTIYAGVVGKPVYSIFSYRWAGLDPVTGDPRGFSDGTVTNDYALLTGSNTLITDARYHGRRLPPLFGSIGNTIGWKQLSLTVRCNYKFGHYFFRDALSYSQLFSMLNGHQEYARRWKQPGDEKSTNVPSMIYPTGSNRDAFYTGSEIQVLKADHIRLSYIYLQYELPAGWMKLLHMRTAQLYANINNAGILWRANKEGIDPDYRTTDIPPSTTYAVGVRLNF